MSSAVLGSLLALAASGAWGVSDFLAGVRARTTALPVVLLLSQFAGLIVLTAAVAGSSSDRSALILPGATMVPAAAAGAAGAAALGLLYLAMGRSGIAIVAPIAAGAAAIPVAVGLLRGEPLTARGGIGVAFAVAGTFAAALPGQPGAPASIAVEPATRESVGPESAALHRRQKVATLAGVGSALCTGTFFVLLRAASVNAPAAATLTNRACAFALVSAWALGRWPDLAGVRRVRPLTLLAVATVGVADAVAELCFASASARAPLSVVTPLSSLYPAIAVLLALVVLRERLRPLSVAGVGCALLGVVLLADG